MASAEQGRARRRIALAGLVAVTPFASASQAQQAGESLQLPEDSGARGDTLLGVPSLRLPRSDERLGDQDVSPIVPRQATRLHGTTVATRARPDFTAAGVRVRGMTLLPVASANTVYDSNVFGQPNGVDDVLANLRLSAVLRSNWSRHAAIVDGFVNQRVHARYRSENGLTYRIHADGRFDVGTETAVSAEFGRERVILRRSALAEVLSTRRPIRYALTAGSLGVRRDLGRWRASAVAYVGRYDFEDAERPDGRPFSQRFRSYNLYRGSAQLGYASGAGPVLFVQGIGELRRYDFPAPPIDRDSDSIEILVGMSSDITPLLRGRAAIGYLHANFRDPTIAGRGAVSFDVDLDYLATELTTVHLSGRRYFQNVSLAASPAVLNTDATLSAEHELLRNLILSGGVLYRRSSFTRTGGKGRAFGGEAGARLYVNRRLRIDGEVAAYNSRRIGNVGTGNVAAGNFNEIRASLGVSYGL